MQLTGSQRFSFQMTTSTRGTTPTLSPTRPRNVSAFK